MQHTSHGRHLHGTCICGTDRHHDLLVPVQHPDDTPQAADILKFPCQQEIGIFIVVMIHE